ncbi:MAG: TetR/AcrR family transcriptional regulator, partial [Gammaproteobacteria bacterium]|nr:TetR/AcrR family transcriptional regulator [Gammaproteobacteria bacterium]
TKAVNVLKERTKNSEQFYRKPTQARGIAKFDQILDAANKLIEEQPEREISLYDVADAAAVATGSVYHFFPNIEAVFIALVERYDKMFADIIRDSVAPAGADWQQVLIEHTERSREFINAHPPALLLIIGPLRTWKSRQVDTIGDAAIAQAMVENYRKTLILPAKPAPEVILHHAIRMLEGFWELSFQQHGYVTEEMSLETNRAMTAYLRLYWPEYLPRV